MCPPFCCLYVVVLGNVREACIQYFPRSFVSLYLSDALHPCSLEAEVKAPNAGEQGHERQRFHADPPDLWITTSPVSLPSTLCIEQM